MHQYNISWLSWVHLAHGTVFFLRSEKHKIKLSVSSCQYYLGSVALQWAAFLQSSLTTKKSLTGSTAISTIAVFEYIVTGYRLRSLGIRHAGCKLSLQQDKKITWQNKDFFFFFLPSLLEITYSSIIFYVSF